MALKNVGDGRVFETGGPIENLNPVGGNQNVVASEVMTLLFMKQHLLSVERYLA